MSRSFTSWHSRVLQSCAARVFAQICAYLPTVGALPAHTYTRICHMHFRYARFLRMPWVGSPVPECVKPRTIRGIGLAFLEKMTLPNIQNSIRPRRSTRAMEQETCSTLTMGLPFNTNSKGSDVFLLYDCNTPTVQSRQDSRFSDPRTRRIAGVGIHDRWPRSLLQQYDDTNIRQSRYGMLQLRQWGCCVYSTKPEVLVERARSKYTQNHQHSNSITNVAK